MIVLKEAAGHEWTFAYPRLRSEAHERFSDAVDLWDAGRSAAAEKLYRELIAEYPEFVDVHHHLAILLQATDREEEAFATWQEAVEIGKACFPEGFPGLDDRLPWLELDNRPFLRAYHGLGLVHLGQGDLDQALQIFDQILSLNPDDNQGIRALAIHCHFRLKQPDHVLMICDLYPGAAMEQVLYGRPLALYQLGRLDEAEAALKKAIADLPLVGKELTKTRHRKPREIKRGFITYGGADQAYSYWIEEGRFWKETPGAIDFVKNQLRDSTA